MTCLSDNHQNLGMTDSLVSPNLLDLASAFARHVHYQIVDNSCKFSQDNLDAPCSDDSFFVRSLANENPTRKEVLNVIKNIYNLAKIDTDCIVLSLVYINRFQSVSKILINNSNWIEIIFISCLVSQKIWNIDHLENSDFSRILEDLELDLVNSMEIEYLNLINYDVEIDEKIYQENLDKIKENDNWSFNSETLKKAAKRSNTLYKIGESDLSKFVTTRMYEIPDFD